MTQTQNRLLRAIYPKKGRLMDEFQALAAQAGLNYAAAGERLDFGAVTDENGEIAPFETLCQRAGDALANIDRGLADFAIVGLDRFEESKCAALNNGREFNARIARAFNMSACSLWIAAPEGVQITCAKELESLRIATSYPETLTKWLRDAGADTDKVRIIACEGGVEDYVRLGAADVICDIVDSGKTLAANGLSTCIKLLDSSAVVVERRGEWSREAAEQKSKVMQRLERAAIELGETRQKLPTEAPRKAATENRPGL